MDYILFHKGKLPDYLNISINSILSVDENANIHLITDQTTRKHEIYTANINDYEELDFIKDFALNLKQNDMADNPLWLTSLERIFYIEKYIKNNNINSFVHFDNDVVLFQPFETIKNNSELDSKRFHLTPLNSQNMVFGYSYSNSNKIFFEICAKIKEVVENYKFYSKKYNQNKPLNEMKILSIVQRENENLINSLDILPYGDKKFIFDPASYGQFLGGTHKKPKTFYRDNFATQAHIVGAELISKRISVQFIKNTPLVKSDLGDYSKLTNLHIHSKKLNRFLPKNYKNYISTF